MKRIIRIIIFVGILSISFVVNAQNVPQAFEYLFSPPKNYVIYKTDAPIIIDGKPLEQTWQQADWIDDFEDIEGDRKPLPFYQTRVKMLWGRDNLYVFAELEEPHIWAYYDKHDMIVYHENDFEIFIDPDCDTHNYYEFEVNAQNTIFDLFLSKPYRNGGSAHIKWNAEGFKSAVFIDGTLNNPTDEDKKWTIEMKIPFSSLKQKEQYKQAKAGDVWKVNFSRVQWQTDVVDRKYVKRVNPKTKKNFPEYNWVWSPQGVINMHYPERWGSVQFSNKPVLSAKKEVFKQPVAEELSKYLWLIYYKQRAFKAKNGSYALSLEALQLKENWFVNKNTFSVRLTSNGKNYLASLESRTGIKLTIDAEGLLRELPK